MHLANFVYRRDDEVSGSGDVLYDQTISNLSTGDKAVDTVVTLQSPSESTVTLTINKHKYAAFLVEDNASVKSLLNLQKEYVTKGSYAVGEQIDTDIFANYGSLTETAVGTATSALTDAVIISAWTALSENNVPESDRGWFFHPSAYADLLALTVFTSGDYGNAKGTPVTSSKNGLIVGYMYGAPVYLTTNVPSDTTGSPASTYYRNLYLHKEAFQAAMQKNVRIQTQYKLEYLGWLTVVDAIYGSAIYRADHGIELDR